MFNKISYILMIIAIILEYLLTFLARILYGLYTQKVAKLFNLVSPRLSMGENIKLKVQKDETTVQEQVIEATPGNVKNAQIAMRASGAHYNQFENMIFHIPAIILAMVFLGGKQHNFWWITFLIWMHLALRGVYIIIYVLADNQKIALARTAIFGMALLITMLIYIVVLINAPSY